MSVVRVLVESVAFDSEARYGFTLDRDTWDVEDGPVARSRAVERPGGGAFDLAPEMDATSFTLGSKCFARSPEELFQYGRLLRGLGADGSRLRVVVSNHGEQQWTWARRRGGRFRPTPFGWAFYQLVLDQPDYRWFGEARSFTSPRSDVEAFHYGNHSATPAFRVTGPMNGGYRIVSESTTFEVLSTLPAGAVDEVDFETGLVHRDGVQLKSAQGLRQRFVVPGGGNVSWRVEPVTSGSGTAVLTLPDTYV